MKLYTIEFYVELEDDLTSRQVEMKLYGHLKHSELMWGVGEILNIEPVYDEE